MTTTMTDKECGHHEHRRKQLLRRVLSAILVFVVLVLLTILIVWLVLRPTKPQLILQDATVYAFNVSSVGPNFLTSVFQVTLTSRNPNNRVGIYYDRVDVYASYRGQQITLPTLLPASYQGHDDVTVWSPFLFGESVPIAPYYGDELTQDRVAGTVMINIRVYGRIRWKVGAFISGRYHMTGNCPAYINLGKNYAGNVVVGVGPAMKFQLVQSCHVDV